KQERWDTSQLLPAITSKHYQTYYQELETWVEQFITNKQQLTSTITPEELLQILQQLEKIEERSSILGNYSYLWYSEDTNNQQARAYKEKITKQLTELGNKLLYFTLWIKNLDEKNAQRIIKALPTDYQYFLEEIRIIKPYTLEEREEQIINYKDNTGTTALNQLYDMITSNFTYTLTINNKKKTLTREELSNYIRSTNPTIRKQAYDVLAKKYEEHQDVLGEIYKNIVNDWETESITIRKHPHSMHPRHLGNHIDEEAITTMLNVIRTNNETFQNYFKLKAKMIGMKKLRRYDLYAPIKRKEKNYQWNEAVHLVLDSYQQFSPTMAAHAKKILDEHHVDSLINKGKMTGAYCMDLIPGITPYVLINYTGKTRDVTTLAHELGHGVHDLLTHKHNGFVSHPPLILAETASIFGEMIITEKLLEQATPEEQTTI
ncbi:MAG: M3 family metallopeptidase, partial [Nanoarchaeota archaeon]|nr:M3 family metallopeptidase [Nanoarchaeota archaeon]